MVKISCEECNLTHAAATRCDVWNMAYSKLAQAAWHESVEVDPQDVLMLALFLAGES